MQPPSVEWDAKIAAAVNESKKAGDAFLAAETAARVALNKQTETAALLNAKCAKVEQLKYARYMASLPPEAALRKEEEKLVALIAARHKADAPILAEAERWKKLVSSLEDDLSEVRKKLQAHCKHQWKVEYRGQDEIECRSCELCGKC